MAATISRVKSLGWLVINRTRRIPTTPPTAASSSANVSFPEGSRLRVHILPQQLDLRVPASTIRRASAITELDARDRSLPRVYGTTQ